MGDVEFIGFVIIGFGSIGNRRGFHFSSGSVGGFRSGVVDNGFWDWFWNRIVNRFGEGCYFGDLIGVGIFLNGDFMGGFGIGEIDGVGVKIDESNFPSFFVD